MRVRYFNHVLLFVLITLAFARTTFAQALDISSGGQPTIAGALGGFVTGNSSVTSDLLVTINFGEVSPLNMNSIVKDRAIGIPNQPYQVTVSMSGPAQTVRHQTSALYPEYALTGGAGRFAPSTHIIRSPFNNDPAVTATVGVTAGVFQSSPQICLARPSFSAVSTFKITVQSSNKMDIFDAIFTLTTIFADGVSSATHFRIAPGPTYPVEKASRSMSPQLTFGFTAILIFFMTAVCINAQSTNQNLRRP